MGADLTFGAVDLGATSGRVVRGRVGGGLLEIHEVHRFPNQPLALPDGLHWDIGGLYRGVLDGLGALFACDSPPVSVGVDGWAVDYGLLSGQRLQGLPYHYRDDRTASGVAAVHAVVSPEELYRANGLQHLPFNTIYQLAAESASLDTIDKMLLIPDLIAYWLTAVEVAERTNASTTGLLDPTTGEWNRELAARVGIPTHLFPDLIDSGQMIGPIRSEAQIGNSAGVNVCAVGSHDTASAVVGVPATRPDFAYISCGTWGLVGVELDHPIITDASRLANFTNERGLDGRTRFLHNVTGLWLLSETIRDWELQGATVDLGRLLAAAAEVPKGGPVFDADDRCFLAPGDMPNRIVSWLADHEIASPGNEAGMVRCIVDSLAISFAQTVRTASELSGRTVSVVHLVGGGARNELLCQLTANAIGVPVLAGPVEATAIGNVLVQARTAGLVDDLEGMRSLTANAIDVVEYLPRW